MAATPRKSSGVVVPHEPRWFQRLGATILFMLERLLTLTLRVSWEDRAGIASDELKGPVIFCLWHNRLALAMYIFRAYGRRHLTNAGLAALVSASKDGAFLAGILQRFGVQPVRGSSSRRGSQAMLELTSWSQRGLHLAITPDGPRGPRYEMQPGVMSLAQLTGAPVIPISWHASRKITLKSWDRFQIPLPFARCVVTLGEPIHVQRELSEEGRARLREDLGRRLREITRD